MRWWTASAKIPGIRVSPPCSMSLSPPDSGYRRSWLRQPCIIAQRCSTYSAWYSCLTLSGECARGCGPDRVAPVSAGTTRWCAGALGERQQQRPSCVFSPPRSPAAQSAQEGEEFAQNSTLVLLFQASQAPHRLCGQRMSNPVYPSDQNGFSQRKTGYGISAVTR